MEKKYYLGYLRDPMKTIHNGFQEIEEIEVILVKEEDCYKEFTTESNLYVIKKNETVDGHKVFNQNASLIGRVGKELTYEEVKEYFRNLGEQKIVEYVNNLVRYSNNYLEQLIKLTRKKALLGELEYQDEVKKFKKNVRS